MRTLLPLAFLLAGCASSPVQSPVPGIAPAGWRSASSSRGMILVVPPGTEVVRLQGIDSNPVVMSGPGFTINLDEYGIFGGGATAQLAGRPAFEERRQAPRCVQRILTVQAGSSNNHLCDAAGQNCRPLPGSIRISGRCLPGEGCATLDRVVSSVRFVPPPGPELPPITQQWQPRAPVCPMPTDAG
jgi:hypothetical protein